MMNDNYLLTSLPPFKYSSDVEIKSTYRVQITLLILRGLSSEKGKKKSFVVLRFFRVKKSEKNISTVAPLLSMNCEIMIQQTAFIEENCACAYRGLKGKRF